MTPLHSVRICKVAATRVSSHARLISLPINYRRRSETRETRFVNRTTGRSLPLLGLDRPQLRQKRLGFPEQLPGKLVEAGLAGAIQRNGFRQFGDCMAGPIR